MFPSTEFRARSLPAIALLLALGLASALTLGATRAHGREVLPASLLRALERRDPAAFASGGVPRLAELDSTQRRILADSIAVRPVAARVAAWVCLQVGTPYRLGPLGEAEPPDADPLLAYDASDCTALLVTSVALAHAPVTDPIAGLRRAQYRDGRIAFADRLHFTTDRLDQSPCWRDITREVGETFAVGTEVALNRRADGSRWVDVPWSRTRTVHWIPRSVARRFPGWAGRGRLPRIAGVAFVQERRMRDGLDVVHEGLLLDGRTLVHASSAVGRVVVTRWADYLAGSGRPHDGVVVFEFR